MDIIRPVAICIFRKNGKILVSEGFDPHKKQIFYRPLGGEVNFGERGENTIRREIREELNAELAEVKYLGLLESIFTYNGESHHELVLVYDGRFNNALLYEASELTGNDPGEDVPFKVVWKPLDEFGGKEHAPLYPQGLLNLLSQIIPQEGSYLR